MPTRGKNQSISIATTTRSAAVQLAVEDAVPSQQLNISEKISPLYNRQGDEKCGTQSESTNKDRDRDTHLGGDEESPVHNNTRSSRSSTRRSHFVMDVSSEDTPLSQRQALSTERRQKRLKLYATEIDEEDSPPKKWSKASSEEDNKKEKSTITCNKQCNSDDGSDSAKQDEQPHGIRRSTRPRKQIYDFSSNASWIFGEKTAKGYPNFRVEENRTTNSSRLRTRHRGTIVDEEENDEVDEQERENGSNILARSSRRLASFPKDCSSSQSVQYPRTDTQKADEDSCMYSRIKSSRRLRSSNQDTYSKYTSTVRNARKASNVKRSSRYSSSSEDSDEDSLGSESEHPEDLGDKVQEAGTVNRENESREPAMDPIIDGKTKGRYVLRKIQPIERYRPFGEHESLPSLRSRTPPRSRSARYSSRIVCSPAHRPQRKRRQKAQNESSTSSSSSDEERFERRKNKSMVKARNRCLPMNFSPNEMGEGVVKDRKSVGSSLADVDPMKVDRNVTFEQVGGLETYIRSLKEMVLFPLLYPEVFEKFSIQAPRGVLFYGPPGTGKTLVARCLANECSQKDRRVAFFMRKGADCLSKWVGESERQLRLLFDQAYQMRPSIIFFDEIDGLAPVRSTRQDQIHSSIVSTLLALMDGLDSRGEVIVIGATNRLDAIDPALRRPGRFDREFHFPLPSLLARKEILDIHLKSWNPSPQASLVNYLSHKTVGYCGADLKALCAEAALLALRRRYPQVYESRDKLLLDLNQINVGRRDFDLAVQRLVPASQRSSVTSGKPLSPIVAPLLESTFQRLIQRVQLIFPEGVASLKLKGPLSGASKQRSNQLFPRLLVVGHSSALVASALLHYLERLPVHRLDLSTLYGLSVRSSEEACVQLFYEARRNVPAIVYLPRISSWWPVTSDTVRATFLTQLTDLDAELPILLLATDEGELDDCPEGLRQLFHEDDDEVFRTPLATAEERVKFFRPLRQKCLRPPVVRKAPKCASEILPLAPPPPPRQLSEVEKERLEKKEEATLRELRIFLREILAKMARNKLFYMFTRPVDVEEVPDYREVIKQPMDLETMMTKIDLHAYESAKDFLADIELICSNALEYNPDRDPEDKLIRHRACTLRDTAYALIKAEMDTDFEEQCQEISKMRKARKETAPPTTHDTNEAPLPTHQTISGVNGTAGEAEIKASKARSRRGAGWSRGIIKKCPAKKRKADANDSISVASSEASITFPTSVDTDPPKETAETSETGAASTADDEEKSQGDGFDDSQGSDATEMGHSHVADQAADTASVLLPKKAVSIDVVRLDQLMDSFAIHTKSWNTERLLRLYSRLTRLIDRFAKLWDRSSLLEEMTNVYRRIEKAE